MVLKNLLEKELADFQTPSPLIELILKHLSGSGWQWTHALEPTCGKGNFIGGLLKLKIPPKEIIGIEIQTGYVNEAKSFENNSEGIDVKIIKKNIFDMDIGKDIVWKENGNLLVIGNPPWITSAKIGELEGTNLPVKRNLKSLTGLDARTGSSNFDIAEYILLKIIEELGKEKATMAMLCKTIVARNVIAYCNLKKLKISDAKIYRIDTVKWFNASADACLFIVSIGGTSNYEVEIYDSLESKKLIKKMGFSDGKIISNIDEYSKLSFLDGLFPYEWRSGIKHDAGTVVELCKDDTGAYKNKNGEIVDIEEEYIFPLLKSSDLANNEITNIKRWVIVPQQSLHQDTIVHADKSPKMWKYLMNHKKVFQDRKSSVYLKQPIFTYFGLGDYSFSRFKVAISGMYKTPIFRILSPYKDKPIMLDDTCYFISCESFEQARQIAHTLNSKLVLDFLKCISFNDSMRPITKKVLKRINLTAAENTLAQ